MEKVIRYHEVHVRFSVSERELPHILQSGMTPEQAARLRDPDDPARELDILAEMLEDALTGNDMGSCEVEDLMIEIDGALVAQRTAPSWEDDGE